MEKILGTVYNFYSIYCVVLALSQTTNSNLKLKGFVDDNIKFDETGRKFSEPIKNTVRIEEIAGYEHFLLFPQCFQKTCTADM